MVNACTVSTRPLHVDPWMFLTDRSLPIAGAVTGALAGAVAGAVVGHERGPRGDVPDMARLKAGDVASKPEEAAGQVAGQQTAVSNGVHK